MKLYFDGIIYSWQVGGGVVRYFNELLTGLERYPDAEVELILHEPFFKSFSVGHNIQPNILFEYPLPYSTTLRAFFRKLLSPINKQLMEHKFKDITKGIFHSTYYTTYDSLKIPQVLTVHDLIQEKFGEFFNTRGDRRFINKKKKCIENADAIICISQTTKQDLIEMYSVPEDKISVIYHGLSSTFLAQPEMDKSRKYLHQHSINQPYLLFVGNRNLYKNFPFLLSTFAKWAGNREYLLVVAGGRPFGQSELEETDALGLKDRVVRLGFVSEDELGILYRNCTAFVYPSLYEGFGLPIIEALACGARVFASDIPAFKEVGGSLVDYFDPKDKTSLLAILNNINNDKSKVVGLNASESLTEHFDWGETVSQTYELYKKFS